MRMIKQLFVNAEDKLKLQSKAYIARCKPETISETKIVY